MNGNIAVPSGQFTKVSPQVGWFIVAWILLAIAVMYVPKIAIPIAAAVVLYLLVKHVNLITG